MHERLELSDIEFFARPNLTRSINEITHNQILMGMPE